MDEVPVDFTGSSYQYSYSSTIDMSMVQDAVDAFKSVEGVVDAEPVATYGEWVVSAPGAGTLDNQTYFYGQGGVFLSSDSDKLLESYGITGSVPQPGTLAISKNMADGAGLEVGDTVDLITGHSEYNGTIYGYGNYDTEYKTVSYVVSGIWTQEGDYYNYYYPPNYYGIEIREGIKSQSVPASTMGDSISFINYQYNPIVFNLQDLGTLYSVRHTLLNVMDSKSFSYLAWADRDKVVSAGDLSGTLARLDFIKNRLNLAGQQYGYVTFNSDLGNSLQYLNTNMDSYKIFFFALSLPVMLLGAYLSVVGFELATSDRRREIGIRKARGATNRQVIGEMAFESVLLGTAAGLIGLLGGVLISRTLLNVSSTFLGASVENVNIADFGVSEGTVLTTVFFGIFLMLISAYRPIKRMSKMDVAVAIHFFVPSETKKEYHMRWDIAALILSAMSIISVWSLSQDWYNTGYYYGPNSFILQILLVLVMVLGVAILPVLPLLLSVSIIRLLTRGPRRIYKKLAAVMKPWTKNVHYLVEMNIERNPKRSSMICMIIALAIAFGLFVSVTMESTLAYEVNRVRYDVGADINGHGYFSSSSSYYSGGNQPGEVNITALDDLEASADIESTCRYYSLQSYSYTGYYGNYLMMETSNYVKTVHPDDFWFKDSNAGILSEVAEGGKALVTEQYAKQYSLLKGDILSLDAFFSQPNTIDQTIRFNVVIIGLVNDLPGLPLYSFVFDRSTLKVSEKTLLGTSQNGVDFGILVDAKDDSHHTEVGDLVTAALTNAGANSVYIYDMQEQLVQVYNNPSYGALTQFFDTEYAVSMAIMTVGVAMIIFVSVSERRQEIACIMARGTSGQQMGKILMGESMTLMILGLLVGTAVGLSTAYLFNYLITSMSHTAGHPVVLTFVTLSILIVAVASLLITSFITTVRAGRIKLAEILRIRGG